MTQKDLADQLGTTELQVYRYEKGKTSPSGDMIAKMADVLNVSTDFLLGRTEDPTPPSMAGGSLTARERAAISAWRAGKPLQAIRVIIGED